MTSEHNPGKRVILRIGQGHNTVVVTVPNYHGQPYVCPELTAALVAELDRRHSGFGWKTFSLIEVLGTEPM